MTVLLGVKWYLIVVLIYFSVMISEVEHLFIVHIVHLNIFLEEMSVEDLCPFFNSYLFLLLSFGNPLYIVDINFFSDI